MRSIITFIAITIPFIISAQVSIGLHDNRFVYGAYSYNKHYVLALEQSIFSENIGYQYLRGYAGYKGNTKIFMYSAVGYFGSTYNRSYWSTGLSANLQCILKNLVILEGKINPHYDSGDGYTTCWHAGGGIRITRNIDALIWYGNIPEYRLPEYRLKAGFKFNVGALTVSP